MDSIFDDDSQPFLVLVNNEEQHSLWPESIAIPDGWRTAHGPAERGDCLEYVKRSWTDLRPASLIRAMEPDAMKPDLDAGPTNTSPASD